MQNLEVPFNNGGSVAGVPKSDQLIDRAHQNCLLGQFWQSLHLPCCHSAARTLVPKGSYSPPALALPWLNAQLSLSTYVERLGFARVP